MTGKILVADCVSTNRIMLKVKLAASYYDVTCTENPTELLELAKRDQPSLILIAQNMEELGEYSLCRTLKANPQTAHIPIALICSELTNQTVISALKAGCDDVLMHPFNELTLRSRVRALLRVSATAEELRRRHDIARALGFNETSPLITSGAKIGLVCKKDHPLYNKFDLLKESIDAKCEYLDPEELLAMMSRGHAADLYIVSSDLSGIGDGLSVISDIRSNGSTRKSAIVISHESEDIRSAALALDMGANDIVAEDAKFDEIRLRLNIQLRRKLTADRLRNVMDQGLKLAAVDPLTGVYNRRFAQTHISKLIENSSSKGESFALLMLDIDHFKAINDTYGHTSGDEVLREMCHRLRSNLRAMDMVARYGGEEFVI